MTTTDTIAIELTLAERHTLHNLLDSFIHERAFDDVRLAYYSIDLEKAAERTRRLALFKELAESGSEGARLPRADLDALRADLLTWVLEAEDTVDEHDAQIVKTDEEMADRTVEERRKSIAELREQSAIDYAHKCVCERIVGQIDAAREAVPA